MEQPHAEGGRRVTGVNALGSWNTKGPPLPRRGVVDPGGCSQEPTLENRVGWAASGRAASAPRAEGMALTSGASTAYPYRPPICVDWTTGSPSVERDYEKLGAFYLGRDVDPDTGKVSDDE